MPGSFNALSCNLNLIFKHSDLEMDIEPIFGGAPLGSATETRITKRNANDNESSLC